jgi:hypothetical protein
MKGRWCDIVLNVHDPIECTDDVITAFFDPAGLNVYHTFIPFRPSPSGRIIDHAVNTF